MKTFFVSRNNKKNNVNTAIDLLKEIGVDVTKIMLEGYSESNGVSVYFSHESLLPSVKIRVSNHSLKSFSRMEDNICFSFDALDLKGRVISRLKNNKLFLDKIYKFLK